MSLLRNNNLLFGGYFSWNACLLSEANAVPSVLIFMFRNILSIL